MATEFKIPNLGDGIKGGDVLNVLVKVGDTVAKDQNVIELETDKATIEVPSSVAGTVAEIKVKSGDKVTIGQVVLTLDEGASAAAKAPSACRQQPAAAAPPAPEASAPSPCRAGQAVGRPRLPRRRRRPLRSGEPVTFNIPNLGDGIKGGDVLNVLVKVGDTVAKDQNVIELETDKATIEVPSSVAGTVTEIKVKAGDKVTIGQGVLVLTGGAATPAASAPAASAPAKASPEQVASLDVAPEAPVQAPAATGPSFGGKTGDTRPKGAAPVSSSTSRAAPVRLRPRRRPPRPSSDRGPGYASRGTGRAVGSPPGAAARARHPHSQRHRPRRPHLRGRRPRPRQAGDRLRPGGGGAALPPVVLPDFSKWGPIERQPMRAIRRKTAEHMVTSWTGVPHVTQHENADVTDLEALRQKFGKGLEAQSKGKLTVTAVALKVAAAALKAFPQVNASIDMAGEAVILKQYVHIGVAVDTDRGLLVPVIRDVDKKGVLELAAELGQLAEKARAGKLSLDEMQGGCFTITNLGGIGGTSFTPIVNQPEAAILGMSRSRTEPVWQDGQFVPRLMLPLSLSYDHRIVDGADGIRFLRYIVDRLEHPFLLALQ